MKFPLRAGALALALTTTLAVSACGSDSEGSSGGSNELTFAVASAVIGPKEEVATYAVAEDQGFFAEEDLKVSTINADGSVAALQAVASGSADITAADAGSILAAREKGLKIKAVGGLVQNWPWKMAVAKGSPIKSAADLRGKKVGVISLASGSAPYARAFVAQAGLDPAKDVELLPVGVGAQAAAAMADGKIDALALYGQAYQVIANAGTTYDYLENPDMFQGIRSITFAVREDSLADDKDAVTRYLRAAYKGMLFSSANPEAAMRIGYKVFPAILAGKNGDDQIAADTKTLQAWIDSATPLTGEPDSFKDWGAIGEEEWTKTRAYTKGAGQITSDVDIAGVWDASLLTEANAFDAAAVLTKADGYTAG
ncbi:NitT/TauT family transport system substrate-binding protein [Actinocorallia herbida]|uniref:NitT/TauT family transport system substrate-binding protein n=1 Tax=Actinocorallia herbida TaxID=58109 RepID=A0A3N1D417_9ACTN|nr:ABC transporter substrate-binding protein [Actinocorallia herbida]ROO88283.1 NitT/TauT family transport system substrate-binding protein [Actinocorallia herbida]